MTLHVQQQPKEVVFSQIIDMIEAISKNTELATKLRETPPANQVKEIVTSLLAIGIIDNTKILGVTKMLNSGNPIVPANLRATYESLIPVAPNVETVAEIQSSAPALPAVPVFTEAALERKLKVFLAFMTPEKIDQGLSEIFSQLSFQDENGNPHSPEVIQSIIQSPVYWEDDIIASDIIKKSEAYHKRRSKA